jgi:hypothetical protein
MLIYAFYTDVDVTKCLGRASLHRSRNNTAACRQLLLVDTASSIELGLVQLHRRKPHSTDGRLTQRKEDYISPDCDSWNLVTAHGWHSFDKL